MRLLARLLQHLLIWTAATLSIVLGAVAGQAAGFLSHRMEQRALAWVVLSVSLVFAGALVQRAPAAIVTLVALSVATFAFGLWLLADGARGAGLGHVAVAAIYIASLGPTCRRWLAARRS